MNRFFSSVAGAALTTGSVVLLSVVVGGSAAAQAPASAAFANFEASQTNPIRLSADGTRLFAVNTPNGTLSVFDVTVSTSPKLIAEIPVGVEPVSVNPRSNDEVWVVNQVSDSVSVVSVSRGIVTDTIRTGSEPSDVVFAGTLAYVSVSRSNLISAFDAVTHAAVVSIPVFGGSPRALAVSTDGTKVYAEMALSGNATTLIPLLLAQSPPTNPKLPTPPKATLIVQATDPNWSSVITYKMPDYDVAVIDTAALPSLSGYYSGVGTINLGMAVSPATGDIFVTNTDALNLTHFEPNLRGHFVNNRITRIEVASKQITPFDLNPGMNYSLLPNPQALRTALAQPTAVVFNSDGKSMWIASFGTDRVALVDTNGIVQARVEIAQASGAGSNVDPKNKKGPRGLALNSTAQTLYVLNRISNTISIVSTGSQAVLSEVAIGFDPTPAVIHQGRGFLYDAKLSGNGTASCASCHVDGDIDHLAWDLGDPGGSMSGTVQNGQLVLFHPMKGPMTTQTLRGLQNLSPYHWRGDHADFAAFNPAFDKLMGGSQLSTADMTIYTDFINSILFLPNPYQNLDRTLPASILGGKPASGQFDFANLALTKLTSTSAPQTCNSCHLASPSGPGTNRLINPTSGAGQPMKNPQLRNFYQKLLRNPVTASNGTFVIDGFGLDHDGAVSGPANFFSATIFSGYTNKMKLDMTAYLLSFDTGTAPAVGYSRTLTSATVASASSDWSTLEAQALAGNIDLVVRGTIHGQVHGLLYNTAANHYTLDTGQTLTHAHLLTLIQGGDTMSMMGVYPGTGTAGVGTL